MIRREITLREVQDIVQEVFTHHVVRPREHLVGTFRLVPQGGSKFLAGFKAERSKEWLSIEIDAYPVEVETKARRGVMWGLDTYIDGIARLFEPFVTTLDTEFAVLHPSELPNSLPPPSPPTLQP
jgi:hypothetical protein